MIQQRPTITDVTRIGPMTAVVLAAGLSVGFIAGQATPDVLSGLFESAIVAEPVSPALTKADDYGTRHLIVPTLTEADDYGTRHGTITTPLTPADDYGVRHP